MNNNEGNLFILLLCPQCLNKIPLITFVYFYNELKLRIKCECGCDKRITIKDYLSQLEILEYNTLCNKCYCNINPVFCTSCQLYFCANCISEHYYQQRYANHKLVSNLLEKVFNEDEYNNKNNWYCRKCKVHYSDINIARHESHLDWCIELHNYLKKEQIDKYIRQLNEAKDFYDKEKERIANLLPEMIPIMSDVLVLNNCSLSNTNKNKEIYDFLMLLIENYNYCELNYYISTNIIRNCKFKENTFPFSKNTHDVMISQLKAFFNLNFIIEVNESNDNNLILAYQIKTNNECYFTDSDYMDEDENQITIICCLALKNNKICYIYSNNCFVIYTNDNKTSYSHNLPKDVDISKIYEINPTILFITTNKGIIVLDIYNLSMISSSFFYLFKGTNMQVKILEDNQILLCPKIFYPCIIENKPPFLIKSFFSIKRSFVMEISLKEAEIILGIFKYRQLRYISLESFSNEIKSTGMKISNMEELFKTVTSDYPFQSNYELEYVVKNITLNCYKGIFEDSIIKCGYKNNIITFIYDSGKIIFYDIKNKTVSRIETNCMLHFKLSNEKICFYTNNHYKMYIINTRTEQVETTIILKYRRERLLLNTIRNLIKVDEKKKDKQKKYYKDLDIMLEISSPFINVYTKRNFCVFKNITNI